MKLINPYQIPVDIDELEEDMHLTLAEQFAELDRITENEWEVRVGRLNTLFTKKL